jgi:hypothetical protein
MDWGRACPTPYPTGLVIGCIGCGGGMAGVGAGDCDGTRAPAALVTGLPHFMQNFALVESCVPQDMQKRGADCGCVFGSKTPGMTGIGWTTVAATGSGPPAASNAFSSRLRMSFAEASRSSRATAIACWTISDTVRGTSGFSSQASFCGSGCRWRSESARARASIGGCPVKRLKIVAAAEYRSLRASVPEPRICSSEAKIGVYPVMLLAGPP